MSRQNPDTTVIRTRCKAINENKRRCKNITLKTDLCWRHLQRDEHLRIKPSGIPNAGLGLYTTEPRKVGDRLGVYKGKRVFHPITGPYVLEIARDEFVNANRSTDGAMRYANMAKRGDHRKNNANFKMNWKKRIPIVKATASIPKDREILINYGREYFS